MKIAFGGSALEVGASFIMAEVDGINIALDCGVRMEPGNQLPDLNIIHEFGGVDAILLTHAHTDHSGALPILCQEFPSAKVNMTRATRDLISVLLYDSLKIMDRREAEIPLFTEQQVGRVLANASCHSPNRPFALIEGKGLTAEFYQAGHIAGAAGALVTGEEGSLFYSGDFSLTPQRTVGGAAFPRSRPDVAILESTYGDRLHASREIEEERLLDTVRKVYERGGKLLIPAFSLGRSQEVILLLNRAFGQKKLPQALKVYVDGMVNDMCRVFSRNPNYLSPFYGRKIFKGQEIFYSDNVQAVPKDLKEREKIASSEGPCVIISSSGMLSGGPSVFYAEKLAQSEKNFIALTGYQDEESPGRALLSMAQSKEKSIKIDGRTIPVLCEVGLYSLSAHADKIEIASLAQSLKPSQLFLNHGNEEAISSLAQALQREAVGNVYVPVNGEVFELELKHKRHQAKKAGITPVKGYPECGMKGLWEHALKLYTEKKAFTVEDLMDMAGLEQSEEQFEEFRDALNSTSYFESEIKRPFLYHAILEEKAIAPEGSSLEANEALALADKYFDQNSGLYKKGIVSASKVIKLYFDFPIAQAKAQESQIAAYEEATGWKAETNSECRPSQAESLISTIIRDLSKGEASLLKSPSYFRDEQSFMASVDGRFLDRKRAKEIFFEKTGMTLLFPNDGKPKPIPNSGTAPGAFEQNQAISAIEARFQDLPHRPYKKSLKSKDGIKGIELSFTTEALGNRYQSVIDELKRKTGWDIWVNPSPNQHEILRVASDCITSKGLTVKKLSFIPETASVRAILANPMSFAEELSAILEFKEKTGSDISFS